MAISARNFAQQKNPAILRGPGVRVGGAGQIESLAVTNDASRRQRKTARVRGASVPKMYQPSSSTREGSGLIASKPLFF